MGGLVEFQPNLGNRFDLRDVRKYELPNLKRRQELWQGVGGYYAAGQMLLQPDQTRAADLFSVRWVISYALSQTRNKRWQPTGVAPIVENKLAFPRAWLAYDWRPAASESDALAQVTKGPDSAAYCSPVIEGAAAPRAGASARQPTPAHFETDGVKGMRLDVDAKRPGRLILNDTWYPGWHAKVDGRSVPIEHANVAFRALQVPAGNHLVEFTYRPVERANRRGLVPGRSARDRAADPQSFRNSGMSISSSGISSDERWRSSMTTSRRLGRVSRSNSRPPGPRLSNPVAMTVTRTSSPSESSTTAPKMMFESPAEALCTISAASLTSNRPRSEPPVMFRSTPVAPSTLVSSNGLEIAVLAASGARFSPLAEPMPIRAEPASCMIVRTSAKSRLISPGIVIRSVMPWTPWRRTSSAARNASRIVVRRSTMESRRSFGITISVSTISPSRRMPSSAWRPRLAPSKVNGRVTTPTVSALTSCLAISAMTGAAPVPVPPPSPAVTKTMSAPLSASFRSSRLSFAAA